MYISSFPLISFETKIAASLSSPTPVAGAISGQDPGAAYLRPQPYRLRHPPITSHIQPPTSLCFTNLFRTPLHTIFYLLLSLCFKKYPRR
ncbi:hypothetical protein HanRHA438_Chr17g0815531 [Helianthus annuus]|nr:hypothetical protein HanRHA438_Chr17g0815531 [Helianthus annuus]